MCWFQTIAVVAGGIVLIGGSAHAQDNGKRAIVIRAGSQRTDTDIGETVARALRHRERFAGVTKASASMTRLGLAAGCRGERRECVSRIARAARTTVVIWKLQRGVDGTKRLRLTAEVPGDGKPPMTETTPWDAMSARDRGRLVSSAIGALFETASDSRARDRHSSGPEAAEPSIGPWTWGALSSGTLLLGTGVMMALLGQGSRESASALDELDAREARLERASRRTRAGHVLLSVGSAVLAIGGLLLAFELTDEDARNPLRLTLSVDRRSAMAWVRGSVGRP